MPIMKYLRKVYFSFTDFLQKDEFLFTGDSRLIKNKKIINSKRSKFSIIS